MKPLPSRYDHGTMTIADVAAESRGGMSGHAGALPSPDRLNLTIEDLPPGFTQSMCELRDNETAATALRRTAVQLDSDGRVLTSLVAFQSDSLAVTEIVSEVVSYRLTRQAREGFRRTAESLGRDLAVVRPDWRVTPTAVAPVGRAYTGLSAYGTADGLDTVLYLVRFFRSLHVASVTVFADAGVVDIAVLDELARRIDTRIKAHTVRLNAE